MFDISGRFPCADLGVMTSHMHHPYVMYSDTTHPTWNVGFGMIRNNTYYAFSENPMATDWDFWLPTRKKKLKGGD